MISTNPTQDLTTHTPYLYQYKKSLSPLISKENQKNIEDKLKAEKVSLRAFEERSMKGDLYTNFTRNPFSSVSERHKFSSFQTYSTQATQPKNKKKVQPGKNEKTPEVERKVPVEGSNTILNEIHRIRSPKAEVKTRIMRQIEEIEQQRNQAAKYSHNTLYYLQRQKEAEMKEVITRKNDHGTVKETSLSKKDDDDKHRYREVDLTSLASLPQKSFFMKREVNIFSVLKSEEGLLSPEETLKSYNFAFDKVVDHINKIKIPILRDISKIGRTAITHLEFPRKVVLELLNDTGESKTYLDFYDIMNVASGRINPRFLQQDESLLKQISGQDNNQKYSNSQQSDQLDEDKVVQLERMTNASMMFHGFDQDKIEVDDYLLCPLSPYEVSAEKRALSFKQKIKELLDERNTAIHNNIKDTKTLKDYSTAIKSAFSTQWDSQDDSDNSMGLDRKIRMKKTRKNRAENKSMDTFLQTLEHKNFIDSRLKAIEVDRSPKAYISQDRSSNMWDLKQVNETQEMEEVDNRANMKSAAIEANRGSKEDSRSETSIDRVLSFLTR